MVIKNLRVTDVMTRSPAVISPDLNLVECAKVLVKKRVGSLILVDGKKIRGMITEKDIVWALTKKVSTDLKNIRAKDVASRKVKTVKPNLELEKALKIMRRTGFRRLPVVYRGNLVGIVTIKDILRIDPSLHHGISNELDIKEEEEKLKRRDNLSDRPESNRQGLCEECGNFDWLVKVDNRVICESCMDEM